MTTATKLKIVVMLVLVSFSLAVIIQNTSPVEAKILFVSISIPLTVLIGGSLIVGYLLGLLTPVLWRRRQERSPETPPAAQMSASADQRQIEFPQRRLEIPTQGLKKKSCSRPLRRPFPRSSFL